MLKFKARGQTVWLGHLPVTSQIRAFGLWALGDLGYLGLDATSWGTNAIASGAVGVVEVGRGGRNEGNDQGDGELGHLEERDNNDDCAASHVSAHFILP